MALAAGQLRHRVALEAQTTTRDPQTGYVVTAWTPVATVAAAIQPLSAREFIAAQQAQSQVDARITIRWRDDVKASMRARDVAGGTIYNIRGVLADNQSGREWLTLVCSSGVGDGG